MHTIGNTSNVNNLPCVGVSVTSVMFVVVNETVDKVPEEKRITKGDHRLYEVNHTCSRCGLTILRYSFERTHTLLHNAECFAVLKENYALSLSKFCVGSIKSISTG